jgi:3-oxoadipate CoA-transferase beta subunit
LTALGAADRIYTNLAVIDVIPCGFAVRETIPGIRFRELQKLTAAELIDARDSREAQCVGL